MDSYYISETFEFDDSLDYYGESGGVSNDIVSLKSMRHLVASIYRIYPDDVPSEAIAYATEHNWGSPNNFIVSRSLGYYIEDPIEEEIYIKEELREEATNYLYSQPNANDELGILDFCRRNRVKTAGKTPLAALKDSVGKSIHNVALRNVVKKAKSVSYSTVPFEAIRKVDTTVEKMPATIITGGSRTEEFGGVVYRNRLGRYCLVDGVTRYGRANRKNGKYLVLTLD